jgi:GTP cyclohydrolase I
LLKEYPGPSPNHVAETPKRVLAAFDEYFAGCQMKAADVLSTTFDNYSFDEMIFVNDIGFVSFCSHHLVPFFGKAHFAYIPNGKIVGLSKIPRLVEVFAKRPQVQEEMTVQIVDAFMGILKPKGCGLVIEACHMCMMIRGVKKEKAYTRTSALRGVFKKKDSTRAEFLDGIPKKGSDAWL